jgi:hypothetical protein
METLDNALSSGDATIDVGSSDDLKDFLAVFDRVAVTPSGTG